MEGWSTLAISTTRRESSQLQAPLGIGMSTPEKVGRAPPTRKNGHDWDHHCEVSWPKLIITTKPIGLDRSARNFRCPLGGDPACTERLFGITRRHSGNASDGDGEQSILQEQLGAYICGVWEAGCLRIVPGNGECAQRRWSVYTRVSAEFCMVMFIVR